LCLADWLCPVSDSTDYLQAVEFLELSCQVAFRASFPGLLCLELPCQELVPLFLESATQFPALVLRFPEWVMLFRALD
jgi:hypothetical protein